MKSVFSVKLTSVFILGLLVLGLNPAKNLKENQKVLPPPQGIEYFHFGFGDGVADFLWLNFIQKAFDCSKYKDPNGEHCPHRWGFKTLNAASVLSPKFEALYKFGAVKLTVLLDDHEGAGVLFERGLLEIKDSWLINYRAAYLYLEELDDYKRAGELLEKAADLGAPFWTRSLASRMYDKSGQLELSFRILEDLHKKADEGPWKEDLAKRMGLIAQKLRSEGFLQ